MTAPISGRLIILSGPRAAGKTTLLQKAIDQLRRDVRDIAGILSLPVEENGNRIAIDGLDLRSGETRRLAIRNTTGKGNLKTANWKFDPETMRWADGVLHRSTPCDLLLIDELGVLEFVRGQGWVSGLKALDDGAFSTAIAVIRPELLKRARERWSISEVVWVEPDTRSAALTHMLETTKKLLSISHHHDQAS